MNQTDIVDQAIEEIGIVDGMFCNIGAGKRMFASYLVKHGWTGLAIDAQENVSKFANVEIMYVWVTAENVNDLVPEYCDLLDIDIDGNDYWVWKALVCNPSIVIIETNTQRKKYIAPYDPKFSMKGGAKHDCYGCSPDAMDLLAKSKGYSLYGYSSVNRIYVHNRHELKRTTKKDTLKVTQYKSIQRDHPENAFEEEWG